MSVMRSAFPFSVAVSLALFAAGVGAAGPDPGVNVTVTNTPANPVPVAGSLGVTGNVTVNNTQTNPVPVSGTVATSSRDDPGRIPYQAVHRMDADIDCFLHYECTFAPPAVPAGKRLVLQHVAVFARYLTATYVDVVLQDFNNFAVLSAFIVPRSPASSGVAAGDQAVQFYLDGGSRLSVHVATDGDFGPAAQVFINLTGYLLDCVSQCAAIAP